MKVKWTILAKEALKSTAKYIYKDFGLKAKLNFMEDVRHTNMLLGENPNMGQIEPILAERAVEYRSFVVHKLSKIVYYVDKNCIEVVDFWDCRREPDKLAQRIK